MKMMWGLTFEKASERVDGEERTGDLEVEKEEGTDYVEAEDALLPQVP